MATTDKRLRTERPMAEQRVLDPVEKAETRKKWEESRPVSTFFPLVFAEEGTMSDFEGRCACCDTLIADADLRGKVTWPTKRSAIIDAVGVCRKCKIWVPFYYIVRPNPLRLEWPEDDGRDWRVCVGVREYGPLMGPLMRALSWLKDALLFQGKQRLT